MSDTPVTESPCVKTKPRRGKLRRRRRIIRRQSAQAQKGLHLWLTKSQWDESKHRRDHGKFSRTQGGGGGGDMRHNPELDAAMAAPAHAPKAPSAPARHNPDLDEFMQHQGINSPQQPKPAQPAVDHTKTVQAIGQQFAIGKRHKVSDFIAHMRDTLAKMPPQHAMEFAKQLGITSTDTPKQVIEKFYAKHGGGRVQVNWKRQPPPLPKRGAQPPPLPGRGKTERQRFEETSRRTDRREAAERRARAGTHHRGDIVVPRRKKCFHLWLTGVAALPLKKKSGHDVSGEPRDDAGRWTKESFAAAVDKLPAGTSRPDIDPSKAHGFPYDKEVQGWKRFPPESEVAKAPVVDIPIDGLIATQRAVAPKHLTEKFESGDDRPIDVMRYDGKLYIIDGTHKATIARITGKKRVKARLYEVEKRGDVPRAATL